MKRAQVVLLKGEGEKELEHRGHNGRDLQPVLLDLRQGRPDQAKRTLQALAQDGMAPQGVRERATSLLQRLGS